MFQLLCNFDANFTIILETCCHCVPVTLGIEKRSGQDETAKRDTARPPICNLQFIKRSLLIFNPLLVQIYR